ncbi:Sirtuin family [Carpediemonas membranifera]|uniref:Sirtuin family n=1 Tax=Carpediemonas membranifera TaxID=201153 RepID=A0A8J6B5D9_9EUKA|nr:Sirtuin family [Carpediemonas membranifera]|eukprot:KAG9393389.1 Sirtuin family [Carpediemonas membranifera]
MADIQDVEQQLAGLDVNTQPKAKPLYSSLDDVADAVRNGTIKNVVVMTGAGASVPCGIPDFRSPGTGLYENLQEFDLPYPEAMFSLPYFLRRPQPFYTLVQELFPGKYKPANPHYFVRLLETKGLLQRDYTQNIDGLEHLAGVSPELLVEAHGTFASASCCGSMCDCHRAIPLPSFVSAMYEGDKSLCQCPHCGLPVKPDIVFFSESLPYRFDALCEADMAAADLVIILGTSLQVAPFNGLAKKTRPGVPRVLVNRDKVGKRLGMFAHERDPSIPQIDIHIGGDIDQAIIDIVAALGWNEEFKQTRQAESALFTARADALRPPAAGILPAQFKRVVLFDELIPPAASMLSVDGIALYADVPAGPNPVSQVQFKVKRESGSAAPGAVVMCSDEQLKLLETHYGVASTTVTVDGQEVLAFINDPADLSKLVPMSSKKIAQLREIPVDPDADEELPTWSFSTLYRPLWGHWAVYCLGYEGKDGPYWSRTQDLAARVCGTVGYDDLNDQTYMARPSSEIELKMTLLPGKRAMFALKAIASALELIPGPLREHGNEEATFDEPRLDGDVINLTVHTKSYNPGKASAFVQQIILQLAGKYIDEITEVFKL